MADHTSPLLIGYFPTGRGSTSLAPARGSTQSATGEH